MDKSDKSFLAAGLPSCLPLRRRRRSGPQLVATSIESTAISNGARGRCGAAVPGYRGLFVPSLGLSGRMRSRPFPMVPG